MRQIRQIWATEKELQRKLCGEQTWGSRRFIWDKLVKNCQFVIYTRVLSRHTQVDTTPTKYWIPWWRLLTPSIGVKCRNFLYWYKPSFVTVIHLNLNCLHLFIYRVHWLFTLFPYFCGITKPKHRGHSQVMRINVWESIWEGLSSMTYLEVFNHVSVIGFSFLLIRCRKKQTRLSCSFRYQFATIHSWECNLFVTFTLYTSRKPLCFLFLVQVQDAFPSSTCIAKRMFVHKELKEACIDVDWIEWINRWMEQWKILIEKGLGLGGGTLSPNEFRD